jgi:hypothetical protein
MFKKQLSQLEYLYEASDRATDVDEYFKCKESDISKPEKYGKVHFISFYCAILARLAYCNDHDFVENYDNIFGHVIPLDIMRCINRAENNHELLSDDHVFRSVLKKYPTFEKNGRKYIAFEDFAKKVNILIGEDEFSERKAIISHKHNFTNIHNSNLRFVSISTSNYGEIYVLIDLRMQNSIFVIFRGTYSPKSAQSYTRPSSIYSVHIGSNGEAYLDGVFKLNVEIMHSILESARFLVEKYFSKNSLQKNKIKVITTGHSLGGALSTIFSYLWIKVKESNVEMYNTYPYTCFSENIFCVSLGAPRCFNEKTSRLYCEFVEQNKITFLRVTNRDDPVPALPNKFANFMHACSDKESIKRGSRNLVTEDCNSVLTRERFGRTKPILGYDKNLNCRSCKTRPTSGNGHFDYLYIMFTTFDFKDVYDLIESFRIFNKRVRQPKGMLHVEEIVREKNQDKSTRARFVFYEGKDYFKVLFFNMDKARGKNFVKKNSFIAGYNSFINSIISKPKDANDIIEDVGINHITFDELQKHASKIKSNPGLDGESIDFPTYVNDSPKLCCLSTTTKKSYNKSKKNNRTKNNRVRRIKGSKRTKRNTTILDDLSLL